MFIIGYLCAAIAMAVYCFAPHILSITAVVFTCVSSYFRLLLCISESAWHCSQNSMVAYIIENGPEAATMISTSFMIVCMVFSLQILAFGCAARSVGNVIFILLAKIKFKWPNYFIPEISESLISSTVCVQTDDSKTWKNLFIHRIIHCLNILDM